MTRPVHLGPRAARYRAVAIPLALSSVAVLALGWRSWDAGRDHRRAAERTVRDYADFAAALVAANAAAAMGQTLLYAFYAADLAEREGSTAPVSPAEIASNPPEAGRCASSHPGGRWFARLGASDDTLQVVGALDPALGGWLSDTLRALLREPRARRRSGNLFPVVEGERHVIAYRLRRGGDGAYLEAHAFAHCFEARNPAGPGFVDAFALGHEQSSLLPPDLVGELPADSLLSVRVADPTGMSVYRSPVAYASDFVGAHGAAAGPLEGLLVEVVLRPELSERLVEGGIPPSRLPEILALLALAALLLSATIVQLRRSMQLVRARERFVAEVSHELRTPLQQILLFAQLLRLGRLRDGEERAESLRIVEREAKRMIGLVERVLTFARAEPDGEARATDARTPFVPLVREVLAGFQPIADATGARVELDAEDEDGVVAAPPEAIRQVLLNVLDNAVKYGPTGQRVAVRVRRANGSVRVEVEDQGPGIPPGERHRVWEPFYRMAREASSGTGGSGIGLAVVRDLLDRLGGLASLGEAPGGGTQVSIEIPVATDETEADELGAAP